MARGFESKDVEYQQAELQRDTRVRSYTPQEKENTARRGTIELALRRAEADLAAATSPVHRRMLEQAIGALRGRLDPLLPTAATARPLGTLDVLKS